MATLRVTAGTLRGRRIPVPAGDVRPTSERARQAFFNIVGERIEGARFLDLFAGSGIFAFEAVSRGAESATAVERDRRAVEAILRRAREWNVPVEAMAADAISALRRLEGQPFDVVYADPPYDYPAYRDLVTNLGQRLRLGPEAVVAVEHRRRTDPFGDRLGALHASRRAEYGEVCMTFFESDSGIA
ncbi:MAG TPA: 16S rRNA (guanine(966)-N(2))-methyltransferase RsmD [Thermoanaerobaculia bacterium]|nr:16S rRNA (guanine(966)-N(2))-methyltransferase RsmD [Thermoanaerobaculia bacterium]